MKRIYSLPLAFGVLLTQSSWAASPKDKAQCPSLKFETFLAAYADDVALQKAFTKTPLASTAIDIEADLEAKPVITFIKKADLQFPLVPTAAERKKASLHWQINAVTADSAKATLAVVDGDSWVVRYTFAFNKPARCWQLTRLDDDSI